MLSPDQSQIAARDAQAHEYDAWYAARGWWAQVEMRELLGRFRPRPGAIVADIGCGTGRLIPELIQTASHIYAGDFSPASIEVLEAKCAEASWDDRVTAFVADMSQPMDLPSGQMDSVISLQAYEHVQPDGRRVALGEFRRILKPDGRLWLEVYSNPSWVFGLDVATEGFIDGSIYYKRWAREELRLELEAGGFRVHGIYPILRWPQLRRLGEVGAAIELAAHRHLSTGPVARCAYWLAEASPR